MKTLRVARDGQGNPRLESLPLPFVAPGPTATARDSELAPDPSSMSAVRQVRSVTVPAGPLVVDTDDSSRRLFLVVSGNLQVSVPNMRGRLGAGDVLFVDAPGSLESPVQLRAETACSYLEIDVKPAWLPIGVVPPSLEEGRRAAHDAPLLLRMFSDSGVAHLTPFDDLFSTPPAQAQEATALSLRMFSDSGVAHLSPFDDLFSALPAQAQEATALSFVCLSPSMRSDWHTEPGTSLLVVLAGGFEVEVGGRGGQQTLRAGDVCLVEDFEGQGHKSSSDGETRFAVLTLPRDHRWRSHTDTEGPGA